jgi:hypothetical protein
MKERRKAGATHSFRLTQRASEIVDNLNHPRNLGGKSRLISDAIEYYFDESKHTSIPELLAGRKFWKDRHDLLLDEQSKEKSVKNPESGSKPPAWWVRIIRRLVPFL